MSIDGAVPYRQILKKIAGYSWGVILGAALGFVSVPITTRMLEPSEFGKSNMYSVSLALFTLFTYLGLDQAFVREYHATANKTKLLYNAIYVPMALCGFGCFLVILFSRQVGVFLFGAEDFWSVLLFVAQFPIAICVRFNELILRMTERSNLYSGMSLANRIINFASLLAFLLLYRRDYHALILSSFVSSILVASIYFAINKETWSHRVPFDRSLIGKLLGYGLPLLPASLLAWGMSGIGQVGIRLLSTYDQLGIYSGGQRVASVLMVFQTVFNAMWAPMAYRWYEEKVDPRRFEKLGNQLFRILALAIMLLLLLKNPIVAFLGTRYAQVSSVYPFLILVPMLSIASEMVGIGISLTKKTWWMMLITGASVVVNCILIGLLVPRFGAVGGAIATASGYATYFWGRILVSNIVWVKMRLLPYVVLFAMIGVAIVCAMLKVEWPIYIIMLLLLSSLVMEFRPKRSRKAAMDAEVDCK